MINGKPEDEKMSGRPRLCWLEGNLDKLKRMGVRGIEKIGEELSWRPEPYTSSKKEEATTTS